jgi:hypothetical protein
MSEALAEQPRLSEPVKYPEDRAFFWDEYRRSGLGPLLALYGEDLPV